jgi:hypothetical protein
MESALRPAVTRILLASLVLALFLAVPHSLVAQDVAALTGVVTDASGAVVPNVTVKLLDTRTNSSYETTTNSLGTYTFHNLLPGPGYQITFTKEGFDSVSVPNLYLAVNTSHTQNAQLKVGKSTVTIEVRGEGSAVSLDTHDAAVGNTFDMNMVHELPVQIRDDPSALLTYQPGVVFSGGADDPNQSRSGSVTGARTDQSNITLDGLDVNDFAGGFSFTIVGHAPVDSVQEFSSEVANPLSAEGRGSGAQMNLVTKSGTNHLHGSAYEYYRTRGFEANDFFNNFATPVVPRQILVRNQFGGALGGPIKKDKLFFFFNYEGRRDASSNQVTRVVPLPAFSAGSISYLNTSGGVSTLTPAQVTALDPCNPAGTCPGVTPGPAPALTSFLQSRYPIPNSTAVGDGLNNSGLVFNAPGNDTFNDYVTKLDYNVNSRMKIFVRGSLVRQTADENPSIRFPGDPLTFLFTDHSYAYVFGHNWTISNTKVNQFYYGETRQEVNFPYVYAPLGTTVFGFDATGTGGNYLSSPYDEPASQGRTIPVPIIRDDFTFIKGKHTFQLGGTFKPIKTTYKLVSDFNVATIGLGGGLQSFNASPQLRPADLATDSVSQNLYDSAFAFLLGNYGQVSSSFNNNKQLQPLPQGTGHVRHYRYYETEVYLQDSWKAKSDLTFTYGLRYQFNSVAYEVNGLEAAPNLDFAQAIQPRILNGLAGNTGCPGAGCGLANPLLYYSLAGKANHAPGLYHPDWHDFQPRFAFAYNPAGGGPLGRLLGDRKTVIRGGAAIIDDHTTVNALNFLQDQNTWVLQNSSSVTYGNQATPAQDLMTDPRFTGTTLPAGSVATPPTLVTPYAPYLSSTPPNEADPGYGPVYGLTTSNPFNYGFDSQLKTPYSETFTLGFQRELPGNFQLEATYVGRVAHRLLAQADGMQMVDFRDPGSGQLFSTAFAALSAQTRTGAAAVTPQPFFENQVLNFGLFGEASGTQFVADFIEPYTVRGDFADATQLLNLFTYFTTVGLNPGVGLNPQFGTSLYMTNKGYSNYNGLLVTLHKKMSKGLLFDVNYTWGHSLDNISAPANQAFGSNGAGGIMCDALHIGVCYGNSDFDIQHSFSGDWVYELPVGRGKAFGGSMSRVLDEVIGGWAISGLGTWRTGLAFQTVANAFPISFANNVPAIFNGDTGAIKTNTHFEYNNSSGSPVPTIQLFQNQAAAIGAFSGPLGLQVGSRNNLRGPHYSNFDIALIKHFPVTEAVHLELRADAFNAFNHANFALPGSSATADITSPSTFGVISSTTGEQNFRVLQVAFRVDF